MKIRAILLIFLAFLLYSNSTFARNYDNTHCYAMAGYHEARGEGRLAMALVMGATYNRAVDGRWPSYACGVVAQRGQYAWYQRYALASPKRLQPADAKALREARSLARSLRAGQWQPSITANHFLTPEALARGHNGKPRFPAWAQCHSRCVSYKGMQVREPDFVYNGTWFYTL